MRFARFVLRLVASLLVSAAFVWLSFRSTDLRAVGEVLRAADPRPLAGYFVILLIVHVVRTARWGILLQPVGRVGWRRLNDASAVGFMMLVLLPLRLGELARPLLIARAPDGEGPRISRSGAMASCVVERVVDGLGVGVLGIVALHLLRSSADGRAADFARRASLVVTGGFLGVCVALALAFLMRDRALALVRRTLGRVAPRLAERAATMLDAFIGALHLGSALRVVLVLALTVLHWALHVAGFAMLGPAFGFHLTPLMACAVLAVQVVGVMVPAGPGMVGTSQFFTQIGLSMFVAGALTVPEIAARAAGYSNAVWMLQLGQQVALGLVFWVLGRVSLSGLVGVRAEEPAL
jgi:uncharacterized protein (TIRG00374 family)